MRKCPDCAEENINENLFCKHCGRCLLAPDPEEVQRSTATQIEPHQTHEGIDFDDGHIEKNLGLLRLKRRPQIAPSVIQVWLLLLNLLVFILMSEIVRYIFAK
jgi:uncharacterized membrane protein YvbJ